MSRSEDWNPLKLSTKTAKMAALLLHRAFLWISTTSAFLNSQFYIVSLMA